MKVPLNIPFAPPFDEYVEELEAVWKNQIYTNNGPKVKELTSKLESYLGLSNLSLVTNGTIALQIAIKSLNLEGEIITTPFSYVATTNSILWEGCKPVFVDIEESSFNLNAELIEGQITSKTTAILATHVFGVPCHHEKIENVAQKHGLKIIYDAAHAFGTMQRGKSVLSLGDISTISFHATKLYHSIEGGAVISKSSSLKQRVNFLRNFGHDGSYKFNGLGINGKMSEVHAVAGLVNLRYIDQNIQKRKKIYNSYLESLKDVNSISFQHLPDDVTYNYSYLPIVLPSEEELVKLMEGLEDLGIGSRRYFFPSLDKVSLGMEICPVSNSISRRILCLPLYADLTLELANYVSSSIKSLIK